MPISFSGAVAAITQVSGELTGTAGVATYPSAAAAANNVSLAEAIRWLEARQISREYNPFGTVFYVDVTNGADVNDGTSPNNAIKTLAQAITDSAAGDTIVLAPGTYPVDVSAGSIAPKKNQTWVAAKPSLGAAPSVIIVADADDHANAPIAIDVDGVVFKDIEFKLVAGGTTALYILDAAQTTAVRGLVFEDCWFNMNSVDAASVLGLRFDDATNAITGLVIRRCRFVGGDAAAQQSSYITIGVGGLPGALIENCIWEMESADGDSYAIDFIDPTTAKASYGITVRDCDFIGPKDGGGDGIAINVQGGTEDEIVGMFRTSYFSNCTAAITVDKINNSIVRCYEGDNATGGSIVNPGT